MADSFAVGILFDAIKARFEAEETEADLFFGWREPDKQKTGSRLVFVVPGDQSGNVGAIGAPKFPGKNPRNLATVAELCTVIVDADDRSAPENERAQYDAARLLFDQVYRAIYLHAVGRFKVLRTSWIVEKNHRRKGAAIMMILSVEGTVPDVAIPTVSVDSDPPVTISAAVSELDVTTTLAIEAET